MKKKQKQNDSKIKEFSSKVVQLIRDYYPELLLTDNSLTEPSDSCEVNRFCVDIDLDQPYSDIMVSYARDGSRFENRTRIY